MVKELTNETQFKNLEIGETIKGQYVDLQQNTDKTYPNSKILILNRRKHILKEKKKMITSKVFKSGNGLCIVIPAHRCKILKIEAGDTIEWETETIKIHTKNEETTKKQVIKEIEMQKAEEKKREQKIRLINGGIKW